MAPEHDEVSIGIVTALPVECAAMRMLVDDLDQQAAPGDPNHYGLGRLPSTDPDRPHRVVVAVQAQDGTRNAAAICTDMARSFPGLRCFVLVGIAGGMSTPDGVRLGDVVVATAGIVDYDHVRTVNGQDHLRRAVDGLSAALLRADRELQIKEFAGIRPWHGWMERGTASAVFARPEEEGAEHEPWPRVHRGAIGSADRLLRDAVRRDAIAGRYGVLAVEMEASGIAPAANLHGLHWFVVRGIADYCDDESKNDLWHPYAALSAAAYARALLGECKPFPLMLRTEAAGPVRRPVAANGISRIVEALLGVRAIRDDYQRRAIMAELPDRIRTVVADNVVARLHVVSLVQTCMAFPDGKEALLETLRLALGAESPELRRVEPVIEAEWR